IAAILISVLGIADGGVRGLAYRILGLAVQVLRRARRLADPARGLRFRVASDTADCALDLAGVILRRADDPILVHCCTVLKMKFRKTNLQRSLRFLFVGKTGVSFQTSCRSADHGGWKSWTSLRPCSISSSSTSHAEEAK